MRHRSIYALFSIAMLGYAISSAFAVENETLPTSADADPFGPAVAWEGRITAQLRDGDDTCFELTGLLSTSARPFADTRFLACSFGYYDSRVYTVGQKVKVSGSFNAANARRIAGQIYKLPLIAAAHFEQLPEVSPLDSNDPFYNPFYHPFHRPFLHRRPYHRY